MMISFFLTPLITLLLFFSLASLISALIKRADFADVIWSMGFLLLSWISYALSPFKSSYQFILTSIISLWAVRLFIHIGSRNRKKAEDFRYQEMQKTWKRFFFLHLFFKVFMLQALILLITAFPILWILFHPFTGNWLPFYLALPIWIFGFIFEAVSDFQLLSFQQKKTGKLLTSGLWAYSRHPNYFGELLQWWAIWIFALAFPLGWITFLGPLLLTTLIIFVSGVKPLEKKMKDHPDFASYAKSTPCLIPSFFTKKT
ncbi:MAG: DUF1295 domain-containing protein [Chlamydiae bacterium]|nr:DUF1295 domain-containing protein [Chlamydiota bacterium]